MTTLKCQCPDEGSGNAPEWMYAPQELKARTHQPNECPGDYKVNYYRRGKRVLLLCSACHLPSDIPLHEPNQSPN